MEKSEPSTSLLYCINILSKLNEPEINSWTVPSVSGKNQRPELIVDAFLSATLVEKTADKQLNKENILKKISNITVSVLPHILQVKVNEGSSMVATCKLLKGFLLYLFV